MYPYIHIYNILNIRVGTTDLELVHKLNYWAGPIVFKYFRESVVKTLIIDRLQKNNN